MWQAPGQRVQAIANSRKRARERMKNAIRFKRTQIQFKPVEGAAEPQTARIVLNDLTPTGVGIYMHERIEAGQIFEFTIQEPFSIQIKGRVVWCEEHVMSGHVISAERFAYRAGIEFVFANDEEKLKASTFYEQIVKQVLTPPRAQAA